MLALTTALGAETKSQETLCIMSYNLRFASTKGPNAWPDRRPLMAECIRRVNPDVFGTQEGVYPQLQDIAVDQPGYDWIGLGRDGGSKGEFMAVFYRKARLQPLAFDHFWLSDTPEVMASMTWGTAHRRMVTWVQFQDRVTGKKFYLVNTHLDHQVQPARERGAALIRDRVSKLDDSIPVILTGDFNCDTNNTAYKTLTADGFFKDTWYTAKERKGEGLGTFNGFKEIPKNDVRIDWILTRGGVEASSTEIVTFTKDGQFPSDHFPLVTWLRLVD
jgi:endonuclease/exonuclease/phosphatase family metal-dependent hydrolase